jgi:hypothetical protein
MFATYVDFSLSHMLNIRAIDRSPYGDPRWECFKMSYQGKEAAPRPSWMDQNYEVWFRDPHTAAQQLIRTMEMEPSPYQEYNLEGNTCVSSIFDILNIDF